MRTIRSHGGPHVRGGGDHCELDGCDQDHVEFAVMGEPGQAVYRCPHRAHAITWDALTPVGHCEQDLHPDQLAACPQGCRMTKEPGSPNR